MANGKQTLAIAYSNRPPVRSPLKNHLRPNASTDHLVADYA
jgi:hypothetical protein